jgi:type 1 glutamine amidotransferase
MSSNRALFIGGCPATYHRLEPAIEPVESALEQIGLDVEVSGIYHPDGGEEFVGDYSRLTHPSLNDYSAVVLYTTGKETRGADIDALEAWVEAGGALVGIHCATDSFSDDPDFVALFGGKFRTHPAQLDIALEIVDAAHPIMAGITPFTVHDELYLFSDYNPNRVHLLAQTRSFDDNGPVPLAWTREQGSGRVFYLSLGHNPSSLADPNWRKLFCNGVEWAVGNRTKE